MQPNAADTATSDALMLTGPCTGGAERWRRIAFDFAVMLAFAFFPGLVVGARLHRRVPAWTLVAIMVIEAAIVVPCAAAIALAAH